MSTEKKSTETTKPAQKTSPAKKQAPAEPLFYIGPGVVSRGLTPFKSYKDGILPSVEQAAIKECAELKHLFVPVSRLAKARKNLADPHSVESMHFKTARKFFNKGDK